MSALFFNPEHQSRLNTIARRWIGTPFFPHSAARGPDGGVDCVNLVNSVFVEFGHLPPREIPKFPMDWGSHHTESAVVEIFDRDLADKFERRDPAQLAFLLAGDVLCFQLGRCIHHIGLALNAREFVHALAPVGVMLSRRGEIVNGLDLERRLVRIYRPLYPEVVAS